MQKSLSHLPWTREQRRAWLAAKLGLAEAKFRIPDLDLDACHRAREFVELRLQGLVDLHQLRVAVNVDVRIAGGHRPEADKVG